MRSSNSRFVPGALIGLCLAGTALAAATAPQSQKPADARPQAAKPAAEAPPQAPKLTVAEIVEKHVAARGGLQAWRNVKSMSWNGKMDVGYADSAARTARYISSIANAHKTNKQRAAALADQSKHDADQQVQLPFLIEIKRPNKSRAEVEFDGKTAVQVYDGQSGWMLRPYLNRNDWEPFSTAQAKAQADKWGLEDPLVDYVAKGTRVELESVEKVDGNAAYKLKLTLKNGDAQHMWIDAHSFLDTRVEGTPRLMDGHLRTVWVNQRDFRSVQGLKVPFLMETAIDGYRDTHKTVIEKVMMNPQLDDSLFVRPRA